MQQIVKEDILSVLADAVKYLQDEDHHTLSELSNHVIHDASIFQDDDSLSIAILVYALSKMVQRCCEKKIDFRSIIPQVVQAHKLLQQDKYNAYRNVIQKLFDMISNIDAKLKLYIQEVITKAKIKKGSKLHEHGISIARIAELLGISQWELQGYIGHFVETDGGERPVKQRLDTARDLFR